MPSFSFDLIPSLIAAAGAFVLGGVWYGPLFGQTWTTALGISEEEIHPIAYAVGFVTYVALAVTLSVLCNWAGVTSALGGIFVGLVCWFGIALALTVNLKAFTARSMTAFLIESGYQLVAFVLMGVIIGGWG